MLKVFKCSRYRQLLNAVKNRYQDLFSEMLKYDQESEEAEAKKGFPSKIASDVTSWQWTFITSSIFKDCLSDTTALLSSFEVTSHFKLMKI